MKKNSKPPIFIGIDPGLHGAFCAFYPGAGGEKPVLKFIDFPVGIKFRKLSSIVAANLGVLQKYRGGERFIWACVEKLYTGPMMGRKSLFSFGQNIQLWYDILDFHEVPFLEVAPQIWMNAFIPLGKKREGRKGTKEALLERALSLCPVDTSIFFTKRGRYLDGRGDSFLLAYYLMQEIYKDD